MLTSSGISLVLISSTFVSYLYVLTRRKLCLIFIAPYCNMTVLLVTHCVITNWPLNGVSYLYASLLLIMTLSPAFKALSLTLTVLVSSFTISMDYVLINLFLIFLTYSLLIHHMFYRDNHITAKYQLARTITLQPICC